MIGSIDDKMKISLYKESKEILNEFEANPVEQLQRFSFGISYNLIMGRLYSNK